MPKRRPKRYWVGIVLIFGFSLIILLMIAGAVLSIVSARQLSQTTKEFYEHPFKVATKIRTLRTESLAIHRSMEHAKEAETLEQLELLIKRIDQHYANIQTRLAILENRYLGPKKDIQHARNLFEACAVDRQKIFAQIRKRLEEAARNPNQPYIPYQVSIEEYKEDQRHTAALDKTLDTIKTFADQKATEFQDRSAKQAQDTQRLLKWGLGGAVLLSIFIAVVAVGLARQYVHNLHDLQLELQHQKENLRITLQSIGDGVITTDARGRVQYLNPFAEKLTGWTSAEAEDKPLLEIFNIVSHKTRQAAENPVVRVLREGHVVELANGTVLIHREGKEFHIADSAAPIRDENGVLHGVVLVFQDVTSQKEEARRINEAQRMEAMGQLAAGVAHEFNNLLQVVIGFAEILQLGRPVSDEDRHCIKGIIDASKHGAGLVSQLMDFTHRGRTCVQPTQLEKIIYSIFKVLRSNYPENIQLQFECAASPITEVDANQIRQVLVNLCNNASDAISQKPGQIVLRLKVASLNDSEATPLRMAPGRYAVIEVEDNGEGISNDLQEKIFDPFFTTKDVGEGTGLGLSSVKGIAESHGGAVDVESASGRGAIFRVYLPESDKPAAAEEDHVSPPIPDACSTVLLADDDAMLRDLATRILEQMGMTVLAASNGQEAVELARRHNGQIDLMLFDVRMPAMSGPASYREITDIYGEIPIIYMTGYSEEYVSREKLPGQRGVLDKPFHRNQLLELLNIIFG